MDIFANLYNNFEGVTISEKILNLFLQNTFEFYSTLEKSSYFYHEINFQNF